MPGLEQSQKAYYDAIAPVYEEHYGHPHAREYLRGVYDRMMSRIELRGSVVLDAMSGGGQGAEYFLSRGSDVTGMDISEKQCEFYGRRLPDPKVVCASVFKTPFRDSYFDLIVTNSLHHVFPEMASVVRELGRILKPGGYFLIWEPTAGSVFDGLRRLWYRLDPAYFQEEEASVDLKQLLREHGDRFELVKKIYGGNLAYLFVYLSMAFRIPVGWVRHYARPLVILENILAKLQTRLSALWVSALFRKKS